MGLAYKILAQKSPTTTGEESFSAVPSSTSWVVSTMSITNFTGTAATITVNLCQGGAASSNANTLIKSLSIPANTMVPLTIGISLNAGDIIRVTAGTANALAIQLFGSEVTP